jgi:hypothetical protein
MKKILTATIIPSMVLAMGLGVTSGSVSAAENENSKSKIEQTTQTLSKNDIKSFKNSKSKVEQTTQTLSKKDIKSLKEFFKTYKISKTTQDRLIEKLNKGKIWDSLKKDQEPVSVSEIEVSEEVVETIATYNDGSIVVTVVEKAEIIEEVNTPNDRPGIVRPGIVTPGIATPGIATPGTITPYAVSPGTTTGGSGYMNHKGAKAYVYYGVANAHFYADFTIVNGGNDYITRVYNYKIVGIGGTATYDNLAITRKTESLSGKASAKLDFTFVAYGGASSTTCWLRLNVGANTYGTTYSY